MSARPLPMTARVNDWLRAGGGAGLKSADREVLRILAWDARAGDTTGLSIRQIAEVAGGWPAAQSRVNRALRRLAALGLVTTIGGDGSSLRRLDIPLEVVAPAPLGSGADATRQVVAPAPLGSGADATGVVAPAPDSSAGLSGLSAAETKLAGSPQAPGGAAAAEAASDQTSQDDGGMDGRPLVAKRTVRKLADGSVEVVNYDTDGNVINTHPWNEGAA